MRRAWLLSIVFMTAACGGAEATIPSTPLAGTIEGKTFKAAGAVALLGRTADERFIVVRDRTSTCTDGSAVADGDLLVTFFAPWKDGATKQVGGDTPVTLENAPDKVFAVSGELDVVHAPPAIGATAILDLRADAEDGMSKVEGRAETTVCQ